jgi:hypothetical protein
MTSSARRSPAPAALAILAAVAGLALTACGTVPAATAGHATPAGPASGAPGHSASAASGGGQADGAAQPRTAAQLCAAPGSVTQVAVTRVTPVQQQLPSGPGADAAPTPTALVKGAPQAQQLAKALCALPAMPTTRPLHCPDLSGGSYRLVFTAGGTALPAVTAQPTGCETVVGVGVTRTAVAAPTFWRLLATMGGVLPLPGVGHLPGVPVSSGGQFQPGTAATG